MNWVTRIHGWIKDNLFTDPVYESDRDRFIASRQKAREDGLYTYLIDRTNHRDQLFKEIEMAVLGRNYNEALKLAREGWQLKGR